MSGGTANPGEPSRDAGQFKPDAHFAADIRPEIPVESPPDPEPDAVLEERRLNSLRAFEARARRRQRRRRLIGICTIVAGTGILIAAGVTVRRRTEHLSAPVVREGREELGQSREPLRTPEDPTSVPKGPITMTEQRRLAQSPPAIPSSTASSRAGQTSRGAGQQKLPNAINHQPLGRLTALRPGDTKEKVFDTFATVFERRNGGLVRIEGIRLRTRARSPHHELVEVADVRVADTPAGSLRWFLFGDGRLLAWGRAEEWATAAERYEVVTQYKPAAASEHRNGGS